MIDLLCGGRHLARTAVHGWVILAAVALAVALTLAIEWLRARWRQQTSRSAADVLLALDSELQGHGCDCGRYRARDDGRGASRSLLGAPDRHREDRH